MAPLILLLLSQVPALQQQPAPVLSVFPSGGGIVLYGDGGSTLSDAMGNIVSFTRTSTTWCMSGDADAGSTLLASQQPCSTLGGVQMDIINTDGGAPTLASKMRVAHPWNGLAVNQWCAGVKVNPRGVAYATLASRAPGGAATLWMLSHATATYTNEARIQMLGTGEIYFEVNNAAGGYKALRGGSLTTAPHVVSGCSDNGTLSVWVDGVRQSGLSTSGAGTGIMVTHPNYMDIGGRSDGYVTSAVFSDGFVTYGTAPP